MTSHGSAGVAHAPRRCNSARMKRSGRRQALLCAVAICCTAVLCECSSVDGGAPFEVLSHGRFASVRVYRPAGAVRQVALLLSGDGGWSRDLGAIAYQLSGEGTLTAGIDLPPLICEPRAGSGELRLPGHRSCGSRALPAGPLSPAAHGAAFDRAFGWCDAGLYQHCAGSRRNIQRGAHQDPVCTPLEALGFLAAIPGAHLVPLPHVSHNYGHAERWWPQFSAAQKSLTGPPPAR